MNVKKMFASLAGVLMLAQAAAPMVTGAATYSDELQGAYDYAYSKGITTMSSIDNANMYGNLTRGQLSKMISAWAEAELGKTVDSTAVCNFTDLDKAEGDLAQWAVKSCQLGLMGQGITAFRPNDPVTRGEFGTVLSRAMWGDKYNQENPFYAKHLQALSDAGIMTKIDNPNQLEVRGWVMLMLQRASGEATSDEECNDPAVLLACALGSANCPAKCAEEEGKKSTINPYEGVQAGDLNVAVSTSSTVTSIPNKGIIKVGELAVKASESIQLQSIDIARLGLSKNSGIRVWIEKDGKRITSSSSFYGDSTASLTFNNNGYVVNGNETLDLVASLDVDAGAEISFKVSNLVSSAKSSSISPDTTATFRTTTYEATYIDVDPVAGNRSYDLAEDTQFSFGEFKVLNGSSASEERNVLIRNITFKVEGSVENLSNFKLLRDAKEVSSKYTVDGKSLTFAVNDQLDSGKSATYKVVATPTNVENASGDNYTLRIKKDADIVAEELGQNSAAFRVSVYTTAPTSSAAGSWSEVSLGQTTIKGGNFTLTRDSNFGSSVNASWGYNDVTIAKGTFKANQAVKYEKVVLTGTKFTPATDFREVIRRASLKIGSRTYQAEITSGGNIKIDSEVYLDKGTHDVELIVSLANSSTANASVNEIVISNITADSFVNGNYLNSDETTALNTQIAGSIRVAKINIAEQKMGLKKDGPSSDVNVVMGSTDEKAVLEGTITNTTDKDLTISSFTITGDYTTVTSNKNYADAYVVLGEKNSSRVSFATGSDNVKSVDLSATIEAGKSMKFTLYAMPNANLTGNDTVRFTVSVKGKADGNDVTSSDIKSAYIKVKASASASAIASTAKSKIIFPGVSTPVAEFEYTVKNDNAEIETVVITGLNGSDISDLTIDFGGKVGAPALSYNTASDVEATFNSRLSVPEGTYNVKVYATFDEDAVSSSAINVSGVTFLDGSTERGTVTFNNNNHFVAKAYPVLNRESYSSDKDAPSLEVGITKVVKDGESATVAITALSGYYMSGGAKQTWSAYTDNFFAGSDNLDMNNISTSKEILKSSTAKIHITHVSFTVQASDESVATPYNDVAVNSIADFAKLTNE